MRISRIRPLGALALTLSILWVGCSSPPTADADAAQAAVDKAASQDADRYATNSFKSAQEARAALEAELKSQEAKWFKSYDRARELAFTAKAAGDRAAAEAAEGKQKAQAAAKVRADAAARARARTASAEKAPVRVGGQIKPPLKVKDVKPVYPTIAQSTHVSGAVTIEATIGSDGKVADAKVVRSVPLLDQAALDAVRQWQYTPTLLNGVPVPVSTTITVNFTR